MKITFIGTADGIPRKGRKLSSSMIETAGGVYFVDMGCQVADLMVARDIPSESVKAVFITHMHGDHVSGLFQFADLYDWAFKGDPKVYLPRRSAAPIFSECLSALGHEAMTSFETVKEGPFYDDGELRAAAVPTTHIADAFAYIIEAEGKRVFFSGDFNARDIESFQSALSDGKPTDALVIEGAHPDSRLLQPMIEAIRPGRVRFNHVAPYRLEHIAELAASLPDFDIAISEDGMEIEI